MVLFFSLDREWGTTRASLFSFRIIDNSEGTPNEFFVIVNGRTFEEFQGVNINSYFHTIFFKYPTIEKGQLLSTNTCTCTYKYPVHYISNITYKTNFTLNIYDSKSTPKSFLCQMVNLGWKTVGHTIIQKTCTFYFQVHPYQNFFK